MEGNWALIYHKMARWLKQNEEMLIEVDCVPNIEKK
jgi:hypothetical protein